MDLYFWLFFSKTDADFILNPTRNFNIPLHLSNYGFPNNLYVHIIPKLDKKPLMDLDPSLQKIYDTCFHEQDIPINILLESITRVVNDSMEYDFEKMKEEDLQAYSYIENLESKKQKQEEIKQMWDVTMRKNYRPIGIETQKGVCGDAGGIIRNILSTIGLPENIKYTHITANANESVTHDSTVVFDIDTGNRVILNSKSPRKQFNLASNKELPQFGKIK